MTFWSSSASGEEINRRRIRAANFLLLDDILHAGTDGPAVALSWTLLILCHYPEVQKKMRDEVDAFIKTHNRLPNFDERDLFPFFISVQKECIRYRPLTPFGVPHEATEDCK